MDDLSTLSDDELQALHQQASGAGNDLPFAGMSDDQLRQMHAQAQANEPTGIPAIDQSLKMFGDATNTASRWATLGLAEPVAAAGRAVVQKYGIGEDKPFGDLYQRNLTQQRGQAENFAAEHPYVNAAAAVPGAVTAGAPRAGIEALAAVPGLMRQMATGGVLGAAAGGGNALADSPNTEPLGIAKDAGMGALTGAGVGAALPLVAAPMSRGISALARAVVPRSVDRQAGQLIAGRIGQDAAAGGPGIPEITEALNNAGGKPLSLADVGGENLQGFAGRMARAPGEGRETARNFLADRSSGAGPRIVADINSGISNAPAFQTAQDLIQQRAAAAQPLYDKAFAGGSIAPLEQHLTGAFDDASAAAQQAARDVAAAQQAMTLAQGKSATAGNVYSSSAASEAERDAIAQLQSAQQRSTIAEQAKSDALDRMRTAQEHAANGVPGAVWSPRIQQFLDDPIIQQGINKGIAVQRLEALASGKPFDPKEFAITGFNQDGTPAVSKVPNMRLLDAGKRGLDEILEQYRSPVTEQLQLDQYGRAVDQVRKSLLGELDNLNPDYAAARQAWAGPSSALSAMRQGQNFQSMRPELISKTIGDMSPSEKEFFRVGAADALRTSAAKTGDPRLIIGSNAVNNRGGDYLKQQLRPLFDSDESFNRFTQQMGNEALMQANVGKLVAGSPTAARFAEDAGGHHGAGVLSNLIGAGSAFYAKEPVAGAGLLARALSAVNRLPEVNNPEVNSAAARMLFNPDQSANANSLAAIMARRAPVRTGVTIPASSLAGQLYPSLEFNPNQGGQAGR